MPTSATRTKTRAAAVLAAALAVVLTLTPVAHAAEHVTLTNGFEFDCLRREPEGDRIRLIFASNAAGQTQNYLDVPAHDVLRVETLPDPLPTSLVPNPEAPLNQPTLAELHQLLARAGSVHHIDAELLASVVHAESAGHINALSRTGARGLMQLMPGTALALGVANAFAADQNVEGGSAYLDQLLTRYHDNLAFALAAYNAGPAAVDRFHGIPPFRETRAYVAHVIREFNRRKTLLLAQSK